MFLNYWYSRCAFASSIFHGLYAWENQSSHYRSTKTVDFLALAQIAANVLQAT